MKAFENSNNRFLEPIQTLSPQERFDALFAAAVAGGYSVAAWRLPGKKQRCLLIDLTTNATAVHPDVSSLGPGFLFAPYAADLAVPEAKENPQCLFLKGDIVLEENAEEVQLADNMPAAQKRLAEELLRQALEQNTAEKAYPVTEHETASTAKEHYLQLVEQSVAAIKEGVFQKNVCARSKIVMLPEGFRLERFFQEVVAAYPNAFVSVVAIPGVGTWVGASPEILISVDRQQRFCTMALAGTQVKQPGMSPADAVWRQKEIEEQAMVSRYIINCLKKIRVREFEEVGPRTVAAANLLHLRTDFTIHLKELNYPNLPTVMLELLHPTSAVCGLPKVPAAQFLQAHEQLDRSFFAGFLGPVNIEEETQLFVNLRCMQLTATAAVLYAGAGITADSVPEREWQETEQKCQTLLEVLQKG